jgi:hypothetical protein
MIATTFERKKLDFNFLEFLATWMWIVGSGYMSKLSHGLLFINKNKPQIHIQAYPISIIHM